MKWQDSYNDTVSELRIMQIREMEIRRRVDMAHAVLFSGGMPSSIYCHIPLDKGIEKYNAAIDELELIQAEVDHLQEVKNEMEQYAAQFEGLANVVIYKQIIENKTYRQMAPELGYSESYLRKQVMKRNKEGTQTTKAS
ncbi:MULTISPECIES: hypothetical protein [Paenibacillus]|uniref:hypothetical protein n=1 Tax=Paenibacillus TaxID=44249 RepID=UPI00096FB738|nr:hypothetical protein [Paenibacillus odorifer]OME12767.1 hypothetical protein BSK60_16830 [Paenibacillus odorifer]